MSDHRTYEARFGALFDGDLEAAPRAEIQAHLAECAQCAAAWGRYTASSDMLRLAAHPTPHAHVAAVMARVTGAHASDGSAQAMDGSAQAMDGGAPGHAASLVTQRRATRRWSALSTHLAALAAGALAMFALASFFDARGSTSSPDHIPTATVPTSSTHATDAVARASASQAAAARRESNRAVATALVVQQAALVRALVERDAVRSAATAEVARARAAEATLAAAQLERHGQREAQRVAVQSAERERVAVLDAERAEAQRAAAEAFAAVALVRSFERLGATLAQLDSELVARADANLRAEATPTAGTEPTHPAPSSPRDWRAIDVDPASLVATGRRAEHVTIRREGDRVALSTSGTLDDIVAALLARLDDPDPAVRTAVELRLDDIAVELGVARAESARSLERADEPWWRSDRGQVAALTIGGAGEAREPWPEWWSRARSSVRR